MDRQGAETQRLFTEENEGNEGVAKRNERHNFDWR